MVGLPPRSSCKLQDRAGGKPASRLCSFPRLFWSLEFHVCCSQGAPRRSVHDCCLLPHVSPSLPCSKAAQRRPRKRLPKKGKTLFIVLNDPVKPEKDGLYKTKVQPDGSFAFTTYLTDDGVPLGKYVVTFAKLKHMPSFSRAMNRVDRYAGGDELKNLYNDPEKNAKIEKFVVDVQQPGKDDYDFDLTVAGKEAAQPGPNSVITIIGP
jgi:hypothetical protein